ncbi:MAG TPA: phospholipid carrier-dependent glycosyltransferase [Candidatus Aenigmarchaeota archaeon]|nr:phospholipid carrier-dependent glycosyltransferase [Candidatus Aenigmarchaeota archaeon]
MNTKDFLKTIPLVIVALLIIFQVKNFVEENDANYIEEKLAQVEPIFLLVNFSLLVAFLFLNVKNFKLVFKNLKRWSIVSLTLTVTLALILRIFVAPRTHRLFFDEDIYLEIGKEILERGKGSLCNYGDSKGCYAYDLMKWPNAYPFLLALSYFFFGISEDVGFNLVLFLSILAVVFIFLASYLLFDDEKIALLSALFLTLTPIHMMWSNTAASEPVLLSFLTFSVLCFLVSFKVDDWKAHALAILSLAFAIQVKTDAIVSLALFPLMCFLLDEKLKEKILSLRYSFLWLVFLLLITPYLTHVYYAHRTETWGANGKKFGLEYARRNIPENLIFWITGYPTIEHPFLFTFFAFFSILEIKKKRKEIVFLSSWFLIFFFLYAFFYAGSVRYGVDVRYTLSYYPAFILIAGYGTRKFIKGKISFLLLIIITILSSTLYLNSVGTPAERIEEAKQARHYHDFAINFSKNLEDDCYILSHVPSMYLVNGKNSLQTWFGQNNKVMDELFNKTDCIIFDDGFWCQLEPYKSTVCKHMFNAYKLTKLKSTKIDNNEYTFFKVGRRKRSI